MDTSSFVALDPSDIKSQKNNLQMTILIQLDRLNKLYAERSNVVGGTRNTFALESSIRNTLGTIEAMLSYRLSEKYLSAVGPIKKKLKLLESRPDFYNTDFFDASLVWYALLVKELGNADLLPIEEAEYRVANNDGVWDDFKGFEVEEDD